MNTDREIYRERPGDYYANSIHVTEGGGIGFNVGGFVIVLPLKTWHALASGAPRSETREATDAQIDAAADAYLLAKQEWKGERSPPLGYLLRRAFAAMGASPSAALENTRQAHSKSEYKRLVTQGADVLPPQNAAPPEPGSPGGSATGVRARSDPADAATASMRQCLRALTDGRCSFPHCMCPPNRAPEPAQADQGPSRSGAHQNAAPQGELPSERDSANAGTRVGPDTAVVPAVAALSPDKHYETPIRDAHRLPFGFDGPIRLKFNSFLDEVVAPLERELAAWRDRADRVIKERDRIGRELAEAKEHVAQLAEATKGLRIALDAAQDECAKQVKATEEAKDAEARTRERLETVLSSIEPIAWVAHMCGCTGAHVEVKEGTVLKPGDKLYAAPPSATLEPMPGVGYEAFTKGDKKYSVAECGCACPENCPDRLRCKTYPPGDALPRYVWDKP